MSSTDWASRVGGECMSVWGKLSCASTSLVEESNHGVAFSFSGSQGDRDCKPFKGEISGAPEGLSQLGGWLLGHDLMGHVIKCQAPHFVG